MINKMLILGGYGNTGAKIAAQLLRHSRVKLILAGRNKIKAEKLAAQLNQRYGSRRVTAALVDAENFDQLFQTMRQVDLVIVAASVIDNIGKVARAAIEAKVHCIDTLLSSEKKLKDLAALEPEMKKQKIIFVTDAGFHPGLPAAMARYASEYFDELHAAQIYSLLRFNWRNLQFSESTIEEMIDEFEHFKPVVFENGEWKNVGWAFNRRADFSGGFGQVRCSPMFLHELKKISETIPTLTKIGFYVSGFNWFTDNFVLPLLIIGTKILPRQKIGFLKNLFVWSLKKFSAPPFLTFLKLKAEGLQNGKSASMSLEVSHEDGYFLTAAPVVACILQFLNGKISQPGLHFQGLIVEPKSFFADLSNLGIKISKNFSE
ncbi:MAG: KR domain-containing protein [Calditrichaeota bacterium]|nr:KR domain-containing protein [Calditrichota bacterium]